MTRSRNQQREVAGRGHAPRTLLPRMASRILPVACMLCLWSSCVSYVPVAGGDNFAYLYGKGAAAMRLDARVYHSSDKRSVIYFKLHTLDLLYKSVGGGGPFHAKVLLRYEAYPSIGSSTLLDSASTYVKDSSTDPTEDKDLIGSIEIKRNDQRSFVVKVTARDLNRDSESAVFLPVERSETGARQDFLPLMPNGVPLFGDHLQAGEHIKVMCEQYAGRTLVVQHFQSSDKLPAPVFTNYNEQPPVVKLDSTYTVQVDREGGFDFTAAADGFDHFRPDTTVTTGFTLFTFTNSFPNVGNAHDLIEPLRYITSLQEWDRIVKAKDPRKEVERFWTDAAGSRERAREVIETYYSRVENANHHFTSWVEGWRTDRGLVSIIFGSPSMIRKTPDAEVWTYGEETNLMSLTFTFEKRNGAFSDNDLVLRRDAVFKTAWYRNVESWRNGRVFQN